MNTLNEVTSLIRRLREPERRELAAWLTESLEDNSRVAESAARYGAAPGNGDVFTVEEYLALEEGSAIRHEYAAGQIYAMSEPLRRHKWIAGNVFAAIHAHLRGEPCQPYMEKTRVNIKAHGADYYYYPDVVVGCGEVPEEDEEDPPEEYRLVVEVMSRSTADCGVPRAGAGAQIHRPRPAAAPDLRRPALGRLRTRKDVIDEELQPPLALVLIDIQTVDELQGAFGERK